MSTEIPFSSNIINVGRFNFWGIPKNANTAIKLALIGREANVKKQIESTYYSRYGLVRTVLYRDTERWVHEADATTYITSEIAITNNCYNFAVIRDPIDRFMSQVAYNKKMKFLPNISVTDLLKHIENTPEKTVNEHFRSQYSYVTRDDKIIPNLYSYNNLEAIEQLIGAKIPKANVSIGRESIDSSIVKELQRIYTKDFDLYAKLR